MFYTTSDIESENHSVNREVISPLLSTGSAVQDTITASLAMQYSVWKNLSLLVPLNFSFFSNLKHRTPHLHIGILVQISAYTILFAISPNTHIFANQHALFAYYFHQQLRCYINFSHAYAFLYILFDWKAAFQNSEMCKCSKRALFNFCLIWCS